MIDRISLDQCLAWLRQATPEERRYIAYLLANTDDYDHQDTALVAAYVIQNYQPPTQEAHGV